jgi:hypothetical protein
LEQSFEVVVGEQGRLVSGGVVKMTSLDDDPVLLLPDADIARPLPVEQGADGAEDVLVVGSG